MNGMKKGRLFILSGPSGVGKGTVRARLFQVVPDLVYSISCTTRKIRDGETDGIQYRFLDLETFESYVGQDLFIEWAKVHGNLYGTLKDDIARVLEKGRDVVLEIDVQGAIQVKDKMPDSVMIFLMPPNFDELRKRLSGRGTEGTDSLNERLQNAATELAFSARYDYSVVNDEVERAAMEIAAIIRKEREKE